MPIPQETIRYKTYVKTALVEGMRKVFAAHVDELLNQTRVTIDFPVTENDYPTILVRFYERQIQNMGVDHKEYLADVDTGAISKYKHYYYTGEIEFAVYTLSSLDRDLIGDTLVQTLAMGDLTGYTNQFFDRIYDQDETVDPYTRLHYINLNTDQIQGGGESQVMAPWMPEDVMVFQTSYRIGATGEFYSLPPEVSLAYIQRVDLFPYMADMGEPRPTGNPNDTGLWLSEQDVY